MIEDYAYAGLDFRGDPDLILPEDTQWGDIGKKVTNFSSFKMFLYFIILNVFWFCTFCRRLTPRRIDNKDVGAYRPAGSSPIQRRGEEIVPVPQHAVDYFTVEQNLEGLMHDIPDMSLDEVPQNDQRHTVGVPASMGRLLRRVVRTLVCYRDHH
jgi:hypothetical protein